MVGSSVRPLENVQKCCFEATKESGRYKRDVQVELEVLPKKQLLTDTNLLYPNNFPVDQRLDWTHFACSR